MGCFCVDMNLMLEYDSILLDFFFRMNYHIDIFMSIYIL